MSLENPAGSKTQLIVPLLAALRDLSAWLKAAHTPGAVIGGVAASLLGRPRLTRDVDAIVILHEGKWAEFLTAGEQFGFKPRVADALAFARKARVLLVRHEPSGIDVDMVFGGLPFEEETVARAAWTSIGGIHIPLPAPEDLIIMKAVAHRPRDLSDIEALLDAHPKLDLRRVRRWVREFSSALEMPEIMRDLETAITNRRKKKK
ncbi:MAG: nucleotidyl transferase AbiEii/AbiGii toxin family protein [Spirochaetota bacterium]